MNIKRTVSVFVQKQYSGTEEYAIRISVRWKRVGMDKYEFVAFNVGHAILPNKWDTSTARVKKNCVNKKMVSAFEINKEIQRLEEVIDNSFRKFEYEEYIPDKKELRDVVNVALGKSPSKKSEMLLFQDAFAVYILDLSNRKSLTNSTYAKLKTVKKIIKEYDSKLALNDMSSSKLDEYVDYLINERNMQNTSVKKNLTFVRSFLSYCDERNLINTDWKSHHVELKVVIVKMLFF